MLRNVPRTVALSPRGNKLPEVAHAYGHQRRKKEPGRHSVLQESGGPGEGTTTRSDKQSHPWHVVSHRVLCLFVNALSNLKYQRDDRPRLAPTIARRSKRTMGRSCGFACEIDRKYTVAIASAAALLAAASLYYYTQKKHGKKAPKQPKDEKSAAVKPAEGVCEAKPEPSAKEEPPFDTSVLNTPDEAYVKAVSFTASKMYKNERISRELMKCRRWPVIRAASRWLGRRIWQSVVFCS